MTKLRVETQLRRADTQTTSHDHERVDQKRGEVSFFEQGPTFANPGQTWGHQAKKGSRLKSYTFIVPYLSVIELFF
jgi:hypothetical protein